MTEHDAMVAEIERLRIDAKRWHAVAKHAQMCVDDDLSLVLQFVEGQCRSYIVNEFVATWGSPPYYTPDEWADALIAREAAST